MQTSNTLHKGRPAPFYRIRRGKDGRFGRRIDRGIHTRPGAFYGFKRSDLVIAKMRDLSIARQYRQIRELERLVEKASKGLEIRSDLVCKLFGALGR